MPAHFGWNVVTNDRFKGIFKRRFTVVYEVGHNKQHWPYIHWTFPVVNPVTQRDFKRAVKAYIKNRKTYAAFRR